jgi:hypothetical protein
VCERFGSGNLVASAYRSSVSISHAFSRFSCSSCACVVVQLIQNITVPGGGAAAVALVCFALDLLERPFLLGDVEFDDGDDDDDDDVVVVVHGPVVAVSDASGVLVNVSLRINLSASVKRLSNDAYGSCVVVVLVVVVVVVVLADRGAIDRCGWRWASELLMRVLMRSSSWLACSSPRWRTGVYLRLLRLLGSCSIRPSTCERLRFFDWPMTLRGLSSNAMCRISIEQHTCAACCCYPYLGNRC